MGCTFTLKCTKAYRNALRVFVCGCICSHSHYCCKFTLKNGTVAVYQAAPRLSHNEVQVFKTSKLNTICKCIKNINIKNIIYIYYICICGVMCDKFIGRVINYFLQNIILFLFGNLTRYNFQFCKVLLPSPSF